MVPANSPYTSVKDLVEAARSAPDTLVCATTSFQGTGRLVIFLLEKAVPGAKFRFVNFKGGGEAVTSTAGGHTTFTTENLSEGLGFVETKMLRVLAVTSNQRLPQAPDVPTLRELGYPITAGTIRGFAFTAGVPKEAVATMESALAKAHASPAWKEIAARNLFEDVFMGSAEFTKYLAVRMVEYSQFYDAIGCRINRKGYPPFGVARKRLIRWNFAVEYFSRFKKGTPVAALQPVGTPSDPSKGRTQGSGPGRQSTLDVAPGCC
jgi:tripartite-type tricarboxylate transporter receptor subunit TctC